MNIRTMAFAVGLALAQGAVWADGVTRSVKPVAGGCEVTLSWAFSGSVESDLVIEEQFTAGWSVDTSTVPYDKLDASWVSTTASGAAIARFAVKPSLIGAESGSIGYVIRPDNGVTSGLVSGGWRLYLNGTLQKAPVAGGTALSALASTPKLMKRVVMSARPAGEQLVEIPVVITSFKLVDSSRIELSYVGLPKAGTLVIEGCENLGKTWSYIASAEVLSGDGAVAVKSEDVGERRFMRMKLLTKE